MHMRVKSVATFSEFSTEKSPIHNIREKEHCLYAYMHVFGENLVCLHCIWMCVVYMSTIKKICEGENIQQHFCYSMRYVKIYTMIMNEN